MKSVPHCCILAALAISPMARAVDFIRQIQLIEGQTVVYDMPFQNKTGSLWSKPLQGDGAVFQLYAYKDDSLSSLSIVDANLGSDVHANVSLESHLVDISAWGLNLNIFLGSPTDPSHLPVLLAEKTVGTYMPEAVIALTSEDPHYPPRVRADRPYQAAFRIGKLAPPDQQLPASAPRVVSLEQSYKLYHPTLFLPAGNGAGEGRYSTGLELSLNGTFGLSPVYQQLPGNLATQSTGEETFSAYVKTGTNGERARVGSATIQVWPVARAEIRNIPASARYQDVPSNIQLSLVNLYPDSVTYARIYSGPQRLGAEASIIASTVLSYDTYSPQTAVVPVNGLDPFLEADGLYTIEVVTVTPFNNRQPERLAWTSFTIDRTIEVNASVTTIND